MKLNKCKELLNEKYPGLDLQSLNVENKNELYIVDGSIWIIKIVDSGIAIRGSVKVSDTLLCLANELREKYYPLPIRKEY